MKNNQKRTRKTKEEKRRLAFEKRNVKKEQNLARYGTDGGSALVMAKTTEFNRRVIAAVLALVFAISCIIVGFNFVTKADDTQANMQPAGTAGSKNDPSGMVVNKYLKTNAEGNYDLTLEAYSTKNTQKITEKIPTDFVLVVDQSGSMDTDDMPTGNPTVQNGKYLEDIAKGAYYKKDGDNYYRVYGVRDYLYHYYPSNYWWTGSIMDHYGAERSWFMGQSDATTSIANAFYFREVVNGVTYYQPINTTVEGKIGTYYLKFSYDSKQHGHVDFNRRDETYVDNGNAPWYHNLVNGNVMKSGPLWWAADQAVRAVYRDDKAYTYSELASIRTGMYINYPLFDRRVAYTKLCYRDMNGVEHEVASTNNQRTTWEFCDANNNAILSEEGSRPTYSGLYTFPGTTTRLSALKEALNEFSQAVADETDDFGAVDNRISIVGFSSTSDSSTHDPDSRYTSSYNNTELLTHTDRDISSGSKNGWQKSECDNNVTEYYGKGLVNSTNGNVGIVNSKISNAINALTANGGTQPEDGLEMAYQVLTNREQTKYTIRSGINKGKETNRNTIVIFFTDGQPGNYHESNQYAEANEVVQAASNIKHYNKTSLFSIGVFGESDGNPLTYDGKNDWMANPSNPNEQIQVKDLGDRKIWEFLGGWMETYYYGGTYYCLRRQWRPGAVGYTDTANDTIFDYMSVTSSNYPDADNYIAPEWLTGGFNGNYTEATDGIRHKETAEIENTYYRMASNQDTLVAAFMQAVTMNNDEVIETDVDLSENAVLKDILSTNFVVDIPEGQTKPVITVETVKCTMDSNKQVTETTGEGARVDITAQLGDGIGYDADTKTISISGFNYTENFIANPKAADGAHGLAENEGKKLVVTIKNVHPTTTATSAKDVLYSNNTASALYSGENLIAPLPEPSVTRHSYTLNVDRADSIFDVTATITDAAGNVVDKGNNALKDVIIVYPDDTHTRKKYSEVGQQTFSGMKNGNTFYFENLPTDYKVKTAVLAKDTSYTYTWDTGDGDGIELSTTEAKSSNLDYADSVIKITSVANNRSVTILEKVDGYCSSQQDTFSPTFELIPPAGATNVPDRMDFGRLVLTKDEQTGTLKGTVSSPIKGNETDTLTIDVPVGWELTIEQPDTNRYTTKSYSKSVNTDSAEITEGDTLTFTIPDGTTNIVILNESKIIPVEGINNSSNHNWIIFILVGIAAIAVIAGSIFLWKKKDEFVEQ